MTRETRAFQISLDSSSPPKRSRPRGKPVSSPGPGMAVAVVSVRPGSSSHSACRGSGSAEPLHAHEPLADLAGDPEGLAVLGERRVEGLGIGGRREDERAVDVAAAGGLGGVGSSLLAVRGEASGEDEGGHGGQGGDGEGAAGAPRTEWRGHERTPRGASGRTGSGWRSGDAGPRTAGRRVTGTTRYK